MTTTRRRTADRDRGRDCIAALYGPKTYETNDVKGYLVID